MIGRFCSDLVFCEFDLQFAKRIHPSFLFYRILPTRPNIPEDVHILSQGPLHYRKDPRF